MIDKNLINRINELAQKSKETGLTTLEKEEQTQLRQVYLKAIRTQVVDQLAGVRFIKKQ
ncbi:Uncharacterized protein YnzC, UPF0291/DUF896 family [Seinonella peptonophila]|uniref:UPF0291 protein SAMN05444392_101211 n=1 Tax=Seinonella peptonophila TaxID=112248 RepID=A0A1M4SYM1_9BACL|nr:DUF896 domain-containing protein [Seinonella peptonophila]SHE37338.1 Uncharacterized protein YnzC, UPF0291/DUF896 family [Seinonella peptonophila]